MPMGEVYASLQKGILDGTIAPYETLVGFKFAEVIKYFTTFPAPRAAYGSRAMNQEVLGRSARRHPEDLHRQQHLLVAAWCMNISDKQDAVGKEFGEKHGVEFITPPEKDARRLSRRPGRGLRGVAKKLDAKGLPGTRDDERRRGMVQGNPRRRTTEPDAFPASRWRAGLADRRGKEDSAMNALRQLARWIVMLRDPVSGRWPWSV